MRPSIIGLIWLAFSFCAATAASPAQTAPPSPGQTAQPNVYNSLESGKPSRPASDVHGRIVSIDYPSGELVVREGARDRTISVVPNTTIYRHGQYATLADLRPGQNVSISVYEVSGRLVAQTIRM